MRKSFQARVGCLVLVMLELAIAMQIGRAQNPLSSPIVVHADGGECEQNSLLINQLRRQITDNEQMVIVIARLGDREISRELNQRRLHNVRTILNYSNLIVAEGEPVKGNGRVEFYVGCKLVLVSMIKQGADICVTCCDPEDDLYPWYKPKPVNRKPKRQG